MLNFDKRFFRLLESRYNRAQNFLRIVFESTDNYQPEIPAHERKITKQILDELAPDTVKIDFDYIDAPEKTLASPAENHYAALKAFSDSMPSITPPDKTLPAREVEYYLGRPIKHRPVQIKYLRISPEEQVTAGTVHFMQKREYTRTDAAGAEVKKQYFTFMLDDGTTQVPCVFFPAKNTFARFESIVNMTEVCVIGIHDKRRTGDVSFRVTGLSLCKL